MKTDAAGKRWGCMTSLGEVDPTHLSETDMVREIPKRNGLIALCMSAWGD